MRVPVKRVPATVLLFSCLLLLDGKGVAFPAGSTTGNSANPSAGQPSLPPAGTAAGEERRILLMRQDLEKEIERNQKLLGEIEKKLAKYQDLKKKSIQQLISIYESMAPRTAALQIDAMPKKLRLTLVSGMDPRKASRIMRYVEPRVAAEISAQMAEEPPASGGRQ